MANRVFFSGLKVLIDLIKPIVPIEIKSSKSSPFYQTFLPWATNLKFRSIKIFLASSLPLAIWTNSSLSSSGVSGWGKILLFEI